MIDSATSASNRAELPAQIWIYLLIIARKGVFYKGLLVFSAQRYLYFQPQLSYRFIAVGRLRFLRVRLVRSSAITIINRVMARVRKVFLGILIDIRMHNGSSQYIKARAPMPKAQALAGHTKPLIEPTPHQSSR